MSNRRRIIPLFVGEKKPPNLVVVERWSRFRICVAGRRGQADCFTKTKSLPALLVSCLRLPTDGQASCDIIWTQYISNHLNFTGLFDNILLINLLTIKTLSSRFWLFQWALFLVMFLREGHGKQLRLLELLRKHTQFCFFETLWYPEELKTLTLYLPDIGESTNLMLLPAETWGKTNRGSRTTSHLRRTNRREEERQ